MSVKKQTIWKEPDYAALYNEGCYREDLYYLKLCYTSLGASIPTYAAQSVRESAEIYSDFLSGLQDFLMPEIRNHTLVYREGILKWLESHSWLLRTNGAYWKLTGKTHTNPAFSNSFIKFLNSVFRMKLPANAETTKIRELIAAAHGDTEANTQARLELLSLICPKTTYLSNNMFIDCYASGFPHKFMPKIKDVQSYPIHRDEKDWYRISTRLQNNEYVQIERTVKEEPDKSLLQYIASGELANQFAELQEKKKAGETDEQKKKGPIIVERVALPNQYVYRKGPPVRKGDAQIASLLYDENRSETSACFNFRGGEFGNWQNKRQECLNCAVDAFSDLAYVTDLPISAMSMSYTGKREHRLTLAWGSRGGGRASAHYEPVTTVINLTKYKGAGSLAHEWGHALDHAIGRWCLLSKDVQVNNNAHADYATTLDNYTIRMLRGNMQTMAKQVADLMQALRYKEKSLSQDDIELQRSAKLDNFRNSLKSGVDLFANQCANRFLSKIPYDERTRFIKTVTADAEDVAYGKISIDELTHMTSARISDITGKSADSENIAVIESMKSLQEYILHPETINVIAYVKHKTKYYQDAVKLDGTRAKNYYSTYVEMFARAFEAFVEDSLKEHGFFSQYLVYGTNSPLYEKIYNANPYPAGEERILFNKLFGELMHNVGEFIVQGHLDPNIARLYAAAQSKEYRYFNDNEENNANKEKEQTKSAVANDNLSYAQGLSKAGITSVIAPEHISLDVGTVLDSGKTLRDRSGEVPGYNKRLNCTVYGYNERTQTVIIKAEGDLAPVLMSLNTVAGLLSAGIIIVSAGKDKLPEYAASVVVPVLN